MAQDAPANAARRLSNVNRNLIEIAQDVTPDASGEVFDSSSSKRKIYRQSGGAFSGGVFRAHGEGREKMARQPTHYRRGDCIAHSTIAVVI